MRAASCLFLLAVSVAAITTTVVALVEDPSTAVVKFRYHGTPRVKCSNCRVGDINYSPVILADGISCVLEANEVTWDCEVPYPVRRFRIAYNNTELVVLVDRTELQEVGSRVSTSKSWLTCISVGCVGLLGAAWRFLLHFVRGPVSGNLTAWFLRERTGASKLRRP